LPNNNYERIIEDKTDDENEDENDDTIDADLAKVGDEKIDLAQRLINGEGKTMSNDAESKDFNTQQ
jgi:hypothetical protein